MAEWRERRGPWPENAPFPIRCRVPVYRSPAPSSMAAETGGFGQFPHQTPPWSGSALRHGNAGAIAAAHQYAILGFAQIGDAHGEPDADPDQRHRERKGREVRQHAMAEIVRFFPCAFIACQIVRFGVSRAVYPLNAALLGPVR